MSYDREVMSGLRSIAKIDLPAQRLVYERSYGTTDAGTHVSTMELFWNDDGDFKNGRGLIEWDVPSLDETEHIGIWTEGGRLVDYDGIMGYIPMAGVKLLRAQGIVVPKEFYSDK